MVAQKLIHNGLVSFLNVCINSPSQKKAELLNNQFSLVFTVDHPGSDSKLTGPSYPPLEHPRITERGVEKLLLAINPSKAAGPDQITCRQCRILKELAS